MNGIRLFVGLGNPGPEYEATRHNAGFWWVDELARKNGAGFRREGRFHGEVARIADCVVHATRNRRIRPPFHRA